MTFTLFILFKGYSTSETWYAILDFGTNYCNLHNLLTGKLLNAFYFLFFSKILLKKKELLWIN